MKKTEVVQSVIATIFAGMSIYALKKREEKIFKKEYKALQEQYKNKLGEVSKAYEAE